MNVGLLLKRLNAMITYSKEQEKVEMRHDWRHNIKELFLKSLLRRCIFIPYIMIEDPGYDGNHINGIIGLTDQGMGVRQWFLKLGLRAWLIDYNIDEQKNQHLH